MKMFRFVPLLLVLGCAVPAGPQPEVVTAPLGRQEIVLTWPEGTPITRVNQLARVHCSVGARRAIGIATDTIDGERVRIYRCEERLQRGL